MSGNQRDTIIVVLIALTTVAAISFSSFHRGYQKGLDDGSRSAWNEAVEWCAEAMVKACRDIDLDKISPKKKISNQTEL